MDEALFTEHAKALIEQLHEGDAHYKATLAYGRNNNLAAAVIVVRGKRQTKTIFKAVDKIVQEWDEIQEGNQI